MSKDDKEAKKEELLEKQEARQLTEEDLEQVTGGFAHSFEYGVALDISKVGGSKR